MRKFLLIFLSIVLIGSIIFFSYNERVYPAQYSIPFKYILRQPDDITCGPTCVTMILLEHGIECNVEGIRRRTKTNWFHYKGKMIGATLPQMMSRTLNEYGIENEIIQGSLATLKSYVSENRLCIVHMRSGEAMWHFVIVYGYTDTHMKIADPSGEMYEMPLENFLGCWSWKTDMQGNECGSLMADLMKGIEIYPNTFIWTAPKVQEVH